MAVTVQVWFSTERTFIHWAARTVLQLKQNAQDVSVVGIGKAKLSTVYAATAAVGSFSGHRCVKGSKSASCYPGLVVCCPC